MCEIRSILQEMGVEEDVIALLINEDITVEDLKTLRKRDLDELIKKYGPRRRFGRALVKWMSSHSFFMDPELLMAYGNTQSTCIVVPDNIRQFPLPNSSYKSIPLVHSSTLNASKSLSTNISSSNYSESSLTFPMRLCDSVSSEEITIEDKKFEDILHLQFATHVEEDFNNVPVFPAQVSEKNSAQQQSGQSSILDINTEDSEVRNPLFILLHNNGPHLQKLIHDVHRNDLVPVGPDINLIGKITAKHLLDFAPPPQRRVSTSTLTTWAKYFKCLFPKTPTSAFYAFKYEPYRRTDGTILQRKRAEGVLQVQLFQERRKLIKENRNALLRQPSTVSASRNKNSYSSGDVFNNTNTWRSVSRSEGEIQSNTEIPREEADPTVQSHLIYLQKQFHYKLTPQLVTSWEATFQYRRKKLVEEPGTVWDYLKEYTFLEIEEIGKALVEQDFEKLYPNLDPITRYSGNLAKNCDDRRHAIIATASVVLKRTNQQKHEHVTTQFFNLAKHSNVTLRVTGAFLLLPFIFPYVYVHKTWKPTRLDIMESFVARVCSETEVQEQIEHRRKSRFEIAAKSENISTCVQPYVLAVGPTWDNISHSHIIVDKVLYTCKHIVEAAELCFKLFHVFHSDYPPECKHVWQLIQQGFYKLFIEDHDINRRTIMKAMADIGIYIEEKETIPLRPKKT